MNQLKLAFYVITSFNTWGRGDTKEEAFKNAKVTRSSLTGKGVAFVHTLILKRETPKVTVEQINRCFVVNNYGELQRATDTTEEDDKAIKDFVVGWARLEEHSKGSVIRLKALQLLWKYEHILSEIIKQKTLYGSEVEYLAAWLKFAQRVNYLQGVILRHS